MLAFILCCFNLLLFKQESLDWSASSSCSSFKKKTFLELHGRQKWSGLPLENLVLIEKKWSCSSCCICVCGSVLYSCSLLKRTLFFLSSCQCFPPPFKSDMIKWQDNRREIVHFSPTPFCLGHGWGLWRVVPCTESWFVCCLSLCVKHFIPQKGQRENDVD